MDASKRTTRKVLLTVLALGAATSAVVFGSLAAWTATSSNPDNEITAGELTMGNSKTGAPVLTTDVSDVVPGDGSSDTVTITNTGTGDMEVLLSQLGAADGLSDGDNVLKFTIHDDETDTCIYPAGTYGASGGACPDLTPALAGAAWNGMATIDDLTISGAGGSGTDWAAGEDHQFTVTWEYTDNGVVNNTRNGSNPTATFDLAWEGIQA